LILKSHLLGLQELHDVAVSPASDHVATAANGGIVKIFRISDLVEVAEFKHSKCGWILFSPDGNQLACYGEDGMISVYDVNKLITSCD
jgi:WD40 repeat protein